jgi:hypothetical protein
LHAKTPHDVPVGVLHVPEEQVEAGYDVPLVHFAAAQVVPGQPPQWLGSFIGSMHVPLQRTGVAEGQPDVHA